MTVTWKISPTLNTTISKEGTASTVISGISRTTYIYFDRITDARYGYGSKPARVGSCSISELPIITSTATFDHTIGYRTPMSIPCISAYRKRKVGYIGKSCNHRRGVGRASYWKISPTFNGAIVKKSTASTVCGRVPTTIDIYFDGIADSRYGYRREPTRTGISPISDSSICSISRTYHSPRCEHRTPVILSRSISGRHREIYRIADTRNSNGSSGATIRSKISPTLDLPI